MRFAPGFSVVMSGSVFDSNPIAMDRSQSYKTFFLRHWRSGKRR